MISIDTNVLVRLVVRDDEERRALARRLLDSLTPERPGFITMTVIAELYWVLRRGYGYQKDDCLEVISVLVGNPALEFDDGESVVEALHAARRGADFADALIRATGRMYGVSEAVTFDRRAAKRLGCGSSATTVVTETGVALTVGNG